MSIGQALSDARQRSGLSVEQVAAATRVRQTVIKAIEQDDFTLCGGDFYARGHIRNIARTVGADPTPLLSEFDSGHDDPDNSPTKTIYESEARQVRLRRGPNWSAAMAAALVLILGFGISPVVTGPGAPGGAPTATPRHSSLTGQPSVVAPTTAAPKPSRAPAPSPRPRAESSQSWSPAHGREQLGQRADRRGPPALPGPRRWRPDPGRSPTVKLLRFTIGQRRGRAADRQRQVDRPTPARSARWSWPSSARRTRPRADPAADGVRRTARREAATACRRRLPPSTPATGRDGHAGWRQ